MEFTFELTKSIHKGNIMLPIVKVIASKNGYVLTSAESYGFNSNTLTKSWEISNESKGEYYSFIRLKDAKAYFDKL